MIQINNVNKFCLYIGQEHIRAGRGMQNVLPIFYPRNRLIYSV